MGFFKRVFGGGNTTLALSVERDELVCGGEVALRWDLGGELDDDSTIRGLRAGVTATAYWLEHHRQRNASGAHRREVERSETLWSEAVERPAQLGPGTATFAIPETAPPSSHDVIRWTAWVLVDRENRRDNAEEVALIVRRPETASAPAEFSGDGLTVTGIPDAVRMEGRYAGRATLTVPDAMKGTVRLELVRRVRHVSSRSGTGLLDELRTATGMPALPGNDLLARAGFGGDDVIERTQEELELDLSDGKQEFEPGRPYAFDFELEMPGHGATTAHDHAQVDWRVEVKLDRTLRGDLVATKALDVS